MEGRGSGKHKVSDGRLRFLTSVLLQSAYNGILGFCLNQWLPLVMPLTDQNSVLHDCSGALVTWPLPSVSGQFPKPSWKCSEEQYPSSLSRVKLKSLSYTFSCFSVNTSCPLPPSHPSRSQTDALACLDAEQLLLTGHVPCTFFPGQCRF